MTYDIVVCEHARERARERFPGFKAARIIDEVRAALGAGRLSPRKPPGMPGGDAPDCMYAWTPCGTRVYVLYSNSAVFRVTTTLRALPPARRSQAA